MQAGSRARPCTGSSPALGALETLAADYEGDMRIGINIIRRALEQPLGTLCDNSGVEGLVVVEGVKKEKKYMGCNVDTEEMVDMFEAGVIDPTAAR